jgi:hypothetical protein
LPARVAVNDTWRGGRSGCGRAPRLAPDGSKMRAAAGTTRAEVTPPADFAQRATAESPLRPVQGFPDVRAPSHAGRPTAGCRVGLPTRRGN